MEDFKIFVVFHHSIHEKCYENLSDEEFSHLVFVAVNEDIPKKYPSDQKYKIIKEWELPIYDPELQKIGYCENTVIRHVCLNKLYGTATHVGFCQYDVFFMRGSIDKIKMDMHTDSIHTMVMCPWHLYEKNFPRQAILQKAINDMCEYFPQANFSKEKLFPMCNTFVLPVYVLETIIPWIIQLHPKVWPECVTPPESTKFQHLAAYFEHVMGIVLASLYTDFVTWYEIIHPTTHGMMNELKISGPHTER